MASGGRAGPPLIAEQGHFLAGLRTRTGESGWAIHGNGHAMMREKCEKNMCEKTTPGSRR